MSKHKLIPLILISAILGAQQGGILVTGEVQSHDSEQSQLYVELSEMQNHRVLDRVPIGPDGRFGFNGVENGSYTIRVLTTPGAEPILEQYLQINPATPPVILRLPEHAAFRPVSGVVSLGELKHPIPKQALRAAVEAQRYSEANDGLRAIAKLEQAIRIAPAFRDAHTNLGAQYARAKRYREAMYQFQQALQIGPPDAIVYSNLSWAYSALRRYPEAEDFARKAFALDAKNVKARYLLGAALAMQPGKEAEALAHLRDVAGEYPKALALIARLRAGH